MQTLANSDALIEVHIERLVEWFAMGGDADVIPEETLRSGARGTEDDLP